MTIGAAAPADRSRNPACGPHQPAGVSALRSPPAPTLSVLALTRYDRRGASSRLRLLDLVSGLSAHGVRVTPRPFFDDAYIEDLCRSHRHPPWRLAAYYGRRFRASLDRGGYDLIWIEKEALPWLPAAFERLMLGRSRYVLDIDDAWYLRYGAHRRAAVRRLLGGKLEALARGARLTIAGNAILESWARSAGADSVLRLPTMVDLDRYAIRPAAEHPDFVIGWIGSPSTTPYLETVAAALRRVGAGGGARLALVGAGAIDLPGVPTIRHPWRESEEIARLRSVDVGIMPLTRDPWSEGKCAYKLLQYMALGLPVVASPVGMNREVVRHGVNGFLADTPEEWHGALAALRDDPALRRRMGAAGRRIVEAGYSLTAAIPRLAAALRAAAGRSRAV